MERKNQEGGETIFLLDFVPEKIVEVPSEGSYLCEDGLEFRGDGSIHTPDGRKAKIIAGEDGDILGIQHFHMDGTAALAGEIITFTNKFSVEQEDLQIP
jgi:hypothetical protein